MQVCITVVEGDRKPVSRVYEASELHVGRSSRCEVMVDRDRHPEVSRVHGRLTIPWENEVYYEDLGSTHGSFVRGAQIEGKVRLEWGDRVQLGKGGVFFTVTWPLPRVTGEEGTHLRRPMNTWTHFPMVFSHPFRNIYHTYEQIGAGGFGDVWRATPINGEPPRAIKLLRPALLSIHEMEARDRQELIQRFAREVEVTRVMAESGTPGIVRVYGSGEDPDRDFIYIIMDYIDGLSLDKILRREPFLEVRRMARYLLPVAQTLEAAHSIAWIDGEGKRKQGIVHRDIKPSNIMVENESERAFLVDFGIAAINRGAERLTALDMTIGSLGYMPPESLYSSRAEPAVDLWALAVTMYVCLANQLPYSGRNIPDQYENIMAHKMAPLNTLRPDVDPALVEAIHTGLHPTASARIQRASEWVEILRRFV
jgi:serine/threonine protein kinase